jgi:hypothetical protein
MDDSDRVAAAQVQIAMLRKLGRPIPPELLQLSVEVDLDEHTGLIRHAVAEGIALAERRRIAAEQLRTAALFAALAFAGYLLDWNPEAYAFSGIASVMFCEGLWLRFTRPGSVKPWGAER